MVYCTDCEGYTALTTGGRCMSCGGGRVMGTIVHPVLYKAMKDAGVSTENAVEQKPVPMWADNDTPDKEQ